MKNLLRIFCMISVLFMVTACTNNIGSNDLGTETIEFSFRANGDVKDGAWLKVSLEKNGAAISKKEKQITEPFEKVDFSFKDISVGETVTVNAVLVLGNVDYYRGSKNLTVQSGDNNVRIELEQVSVLLSLLPGNVDLTAAELENSYFSVEVDGQKISPVPIESGAGSVNVPIGFREIGETINIKGEIIKVIDAKEVVLYCVETKHVVTKDDKDIKLNLDPTFVDLEVVPANQISTAVFDSAKINVSVNGVPSNPVTITKDAAIPSLNIGRHFFGDTVNIDVKIQRDVQDIFTPDVVDQSVTATYFTYSQPYVVKKGENKISLNLKPYTGTVLWGCTDMGDRKMMIRYEDLPTDNHNLISIDSGLPSIYVRDIAFGPDGDLWVFNINDSAFQIINYVHGFYPGIQSGCTYYNLSTLPVLQNDSVEPYYVNDITYYDNGLLLSACPGAVGAIYKLTKTGAAGSGLFDCVKMTMTPPSGLTRPNPVCSLTSGNTIYTAFVSADQNKSFHIYKGTISGNNITYDSAPLINSATYEESGKKLFADSDFIVTDMQLMGDTLYALVCDVKTGPTSGGYGSNHSRGALIEIASNGTVKVVGLHDKKLNTASIKVDGESGYNTIENANKIYMLNDTQTELIGSNFVGPRKFIAIKPKKLVIADAGAIKVGTDVSKDEKELKKRIITVNLEDNFNFESIIDCKDKSFSGSFSSGYAYAGEF